MNESFSWKRFGLLVRAELAGERRTLLLKLGGFALLCLVMYSLWNINVIFRQDLLLEGDILMPRLVVIFSFAVLVLLNLSTSFKHYFSKGRAVEAFMVPAARSEKFLYAVLKNMIAVPLVLLAILLANDLFWGSVLGFDDLAGVYGKIIIKNWWNTQYVQAMLWGLANGFALAAFFLAGGAVFRRRQRLWTPLAFFVLNIPLIVLLQVEPGFANAIERSFDSMGGMTALNIFTVCWGGLWIYIAWRRFSTLQITR